MIKVTFKGSTAEDMREGVIVELARRIELHQASKITLRTSKSIIQVNAKINELEALKDFFQSLTIEAKRS